MQAVQTLSQFYEGTYVAPHVHEGIQCMEAINQLTAKGFWLMHVTLTMHTSPWRIPAVRQFIQKSSTRYSDTGAIQGSWLSFQDETMEMMRTSKHTCESDSELLKSFHHNQLTMMEQIKDVLTVMATNQYHYHQACMSPENTAACRQALHRPCAAIHAKGLRQTPMHHF